MRTQVVKIGSDIYTLTAVDAYKSGAIAIELLSDFAPILVALMDGDIALVNKELRESSKAEKLMRILQEIINVDILLKNGDLVKFWQEEFSCKPLTLFQLGIEALRFNCEDFFTFISGFAKERNLGVNWQETMQNLRSEGLEIPPVFSLLFQTGDTETEVKETKSKKKQK